MTALSEVLGLISSRTAPAFTPFLYLPMHSLALPPFPISHSLFFSSREKDLTQHRFCSAWVRARTDGAQAESLFASVSLTLLTEEAIVHTSTSETLPHTWKHINKGWMLAVNKEGMLEETWVMITQLSRLLLVYVCLLIIVLSCPLFF